jgi:PAS domain S-box-containing protein
MDYSNRALKQVGEPPTNPPATSSMARPITLGNSDGLFREAIEAVPAAVYMTDADGCLTFYNEAAAALWGCRPELGERKFCGSWKLYWPDGTPLSHDECPMAMALQQRRPIRGIEAVAERPDGSRISFVPYPTPLFDATGKLTGAVNMLVDIGEHKRAETRLAERNAQLDLAGKIARIGSFIYDDATQKLQLSAGCAAIYGLPEGMLEISREDWRTLVHPDDLRLLDVVTRRALANCETELVLEFRILRRGEVRWIESRVLIFYNEVGRAFRRIGAEVDVTERKRVELALAERNTQIELASKAARVGSLAIDFHSGLVKLSPGCATIFGLPESTLEMSRADGNKLIHPDDLASLELRRDQALLKQQREFIAQYRIRRADNSEVKWIEARSVILYDRGGKPAQMIGVRIDINDRKLAADMLAERTLQLELAGKVGRVGTYAYDVSTEKLQVSDGYAAVHGLTEGTTETTLSEWRARVHPEDLGRVESVHHQAVADTRREYSVEYRIVRSDGECRWIERRCLISYDSDARPQRVVGVSIDITERKHAEERRNALNAELDHRVKNVLATVQAVAGHTMNASSSIEHFVAALDGRIRSLGSTHEILSHRGWLGIPLEELVRRELAPYATGSNAEICGPEVMLGAEAGQIVGMVLHELTTNAAKYGALSAPSGRVSIRWHLSRNVSMSDRLVFEWREAGGPRVVSPCKSSYGMNVVRELIPYELGGTVEYVLSTEGAKCQIDIPLSRLSGGSSYNCKASIPTVQ